MDAAAKPDSSWRGFTPVPTSWTVVSSPNSSFNFPPVEHRAMLAQPDLNEECVDGFTARPRGYADQRSSRRAAGRRGEDLPHRSSLFGLLYPVHTRRISPGVAGTRACPGTKSGDRQHREVDQERAFDTARDLVAGKPDVLVGLDVVAAGALARQTRQIPVVAGIRDPMGGMFAGGCSLAKPGGMRPA